MTILEAAASLRSGETSSIQLLESTLARISERDRDLNSFLTVMDEPARSRAAALDSELAQGKDRGPLHGIPIAVKDLFYTKGIRTTGGSKIFENFIPSHNATVIERLEDAGAVVVGKTTLHELAYGVTSTNPHFGAVHNPCKLDCIPGGSSGGSGAAVAAGLVPMAMGSDTGGSIRIPASFCGTVGIKATFGRVSKYGCLPLGLSLDHMGPLTMTVADSAITLNAIAGHDPRDPNSSTRPVEDYMPSGISSLEGVRVGWPENFYFDGLDPAVRSVVERTRSLAEALGAKIVPVRVPDIQALNTVSRVVLMSEASAVLERHMDDRSRFGADVLALLDQGRFLSATSYVNAQRLRLLFQEEFRAMFEKIDCLFTPTAPIPAPRIDQKTVLIDGVEEDVRLATTRFVRAINAVGLPAISLPCGSNTEGLPIGLQIVGRAFEEKLLLQIAAEVESALRLQ